MAPLRIVEHEPNGTNNFLANHTASGWHLLSRFVENDEWPTPDDIFRSELSNQTFETVRPGTDGVCWKLISLYFHSLLRNSAFFVSDVEQRRVRRKVEASLRELTAGSTEEYRAVIGNVKSKLIKFLFDVDDPTVFVYPANKLTRLKSDLIGFPPFPSSFERRHFERTETILRSY